MTEAAGPVLAWSGAAPSASLATALRDAGAYVVRGPKAAAVLRVLHTRDGRVPRPPSGELPWVWLPAGAPTNEALAEAALRGAVDGFHDAQPTLTAERLARRAREAASARADDEPPPLPSPTFVSQSKVIKDVLAQLARAARTSMPVLITGETGTGKEVAARLLHAWSARHAHRFIPVNCAAIPNELMEAELFGYARGAFSGAVRDYEGQLAAAAAGTVFLDEIDDTPFSLQVKLLRVLEDKVVTRLGENAQHVIDFRLVAATNRDLEPLIAEGKFGADLFERLAIVSIVLPPLRDRLDDVAPLARHFCARFHAEEPAPKPGGPVVDVAAEAVAALQAYPWPGNVRELRNVVFQALVDKRAGGELLLADLPARVLRKRPASETSLERDLVAGKFNLRRAVADLERTALRLALAASDGNAAHAARLLGEVGRGAARDPGGTVRSMMKRLGVRGATPFNKP